MSTNREKAFMSELADLLDRYGDIEIVDNVNKTVLFKGDSFRDMVNDVNRASLGVVNVNDEKINVRYGFVSEDTIRCVTSEGKVFYTHYKSLDD